MPNIVRALPTVTFSSGATNSPALTNLDDASSVGIFVTTGSTGTTYTVQVEPTDTGTSFVDLTLGTTANNPVTVGTSQLLVISNIPFRQIRLVATGAVNSGVGLTGLKQITV